MEKCPECGSANLSGWEFRGGYDGVSCRDCQDCKASFDRWSGLKIRKIYRPQGENYTQPMFWLEDGSMSWYRERRYNPIHKKMDGLHKHLGELREKFDKAINEFLESNSK